MDAVENIDIEERRDDARPFFVRNAGEVGIYIDAIEAMPKNPKEYGSEHFFMMSLMEKMFECFISQDLVEIKGRIERHDVLDGVVLERFQKGIILAVSFNHESCLDHIIEIYELGKLTVVLQEVLVTKTLLVACGANKIRLRAQIWSDECRPCRDEIKSRPGLLIPLAEMGSDLELLKGVRVYQRKLVSEIMKLRDVESQIEQSLGDMIHSVKQVMPPRVTRVETLRDFLKYSKTALSRPGAGVTVIKTYMGTLETGKKLYDEIDKRVCHTLAQIHGVCEKEQQMMIKNAIKETCKRMRTLLHKDSNINDVVYTEWQGKILKREQPVFMGAVSLIPLIVDGILEIDHNTDEYISQFPDEI